MNYLFELGTEELPANKVDYIRKQLQQCWQQLLDSNHIKFNTIKSYATPRRLALLTRNMAYHQSDWIKQRAGPWFHQAFDDEGNPTKAAIGFAQSCSVSIDQLKVIINDKGQQRLSFSEQQKGQPTETIIPTIIEQLFKQIHLPQSMRWGSSHHQFLRPVRWICSVMNDQHLPIKLFDKDSTAQSMGHRFIHPHSIAIDDAANYLQCLEKASVIADQHLRKQQIVSGIATIAEKLKLTACYSTDLLEELTYLVEKPYLLLCGFDQQFLNLPDKLLEATMVKHQKYIYMTNSNGNIEPFFITVSNMQDSQGNIVRGNQRVLRPRLSDAAFFLNKDINTGIGTMAAKLDTVDFETSLGNMAQKSQRLQELVRELAIQTGADRQAAIMSASLCKADLVSLMVGEFPTLQGVMGGEYAARDKQPADVCQAIEEHYLPRFSGDKLPEGLLAQLLSIADRLDTVTGLFLIGKRPTGDKDPYGLRRLALAIIRVASTIPTLADLHSLTILAVKAYKKDDVPEGLVSFFLERMRFWYIDQGMATQAFVAVSSTSWSNLFDFDQRMQALYNIENQQTITALGMLTKRIGNIIGETRSSVINKDLLKDEAEKQLFETIKSLQPKLEQTASRQQYQDYLETLIAFRQPVTRFFDLVMVNSDNKELKNNRIALLSEVYTLCTLVADISKLELTP